MTDPYGASPAYPVTAPPQIPPQYAPPLAGPAVPVAFEPEPEDVPYAHWWQRVAATLIDFVLQIPFQIAQVIGLIIAVDGGGLAWSDKSGFAWWTEPVVIANVHQYTGATWTGLVISGIASFAGTVFVWWNMVFRQGRRGASIGKACLHLMVVSEADGRPIGAPLTFVRGWVHLLDLLTAGLGYLWPLWDSKRQTFTDMVMHTAVLHLPPLPPQPRQDGVRAW